MEVLTLRELVELARKAVFVHGFLEGKHLIFVRVPDGRAYGDFVVGERGREPAKGVAHIPVLVERAGKDTRATIIPREHYKHILAALRGKRKPPKEYIRNILPGPFRISGGRVEHEQVFEYVPERDEFRQPTEVRYLLIPREKRNLWLFLRGARGSVWEILSYLRSRKR